MRRAVNMILTALSGAVVMVWIWKFFGPGGNVARRAGNAALSGAGFGIGGLFWISLSVVCGGYLLWRFMIRLFWRKYFDDDPPPED